MSDQDSAAIHTWREVRGPGWEYWASIVGIWGAATLAIWVEATDLGHRPLGRNALEGLAACAVFGGLLLLIWWRYRRFPLASVEFDLTRKETTFRSCHLSHGAVHNHRVEELRIPFSDIFGVRKEKDYIGYFHVVETAEGDLSLHHMRRRKELLSLLDAIITTNRETDPDFARRRSTRSRPRTAWWAWLILFGATGALFWFAWRVMYHGENWLRW